MSLSENEPLNEHDSLPATTDMPGPASTSAPTDGVEALANDATLAPTDGVDVLVNDTVPAPKDGVERLANDTAPAPTNGDEALVVDATPACMCSTEGRSLVVCIDGTANQFGMRNTNVIELCSRLVADERQLIYYDSGVGTYVAESNIFVRLKQKVEHIIDLAIAVNHKRITLSAYQWLSENYISGDRIYLFGFSRGAYQVRILTGMIDTVGLLRKGNNNQIAFAYQLYLAMMKVKRRRQAKSSDTAELPNTAKSPETKAICEQFKLILCHRNVRVHFVGAWDTVSSIGTTRGPSFPETTTGMLHVCVFRHALALLELRVKFLPEYARGGCGPLPGKGNVKEVWFIGSHSDIGGGNKENLSGANHGPPLRWMLYEAIKHGLRIQPHQRALRWSAPQHKESMVGFWHILEFWPFKRLSYNGENGNAVKRWPPHLYAGRRIQDGQLIHETAVKYLRDNPTIKTKARVFRKDTWRPVEDELDFLPVEPDFHRQMVTEAVDSIQQATELGADPLPHSFATVLDELTSSAIGCQLLADSFATRSTQTLLDSLGIIYDFFGKFVLTGEAQNTVTSYIVTTLVGRPSESCVVRPSTKLAKWLQFSSSDDSAAIMRTFGSRVLSRHDSDVNAVCWSPDGKYIASGSDGGTILLWNAETGQPEGDPFEGHDDYVYSVDFSSDGTRIVSGSRDGTVRLWDVDTRRAVRKPFKHGDRVLSVAFSPNGEHIASGSADGTVRIWDAKSPQSVSSLSRSGDMSWVFSVDYSPNGDLIAAGSATDCIYILDAKKLEVVKVLNGHSNTVRSVAFTPDGQHIVSGSDDTTIRVWSIETGKTIFDESLRGHTDYVRAVSVSPCGRYIASGSDDQTVRLWGAKTGQEISLWGAKTGQEISSPLRGHTSLVVSVAFSPDRDSRHLVSGSWDESLILWDFHISDDNVQNPS